MRILAFPCALQAFGVKGVQLEELWSMDDDAFAPLDDVFGLLFLFKWQDARASGGAGRGHAASAQEEDTLGAAGAGRRVVFMKQTINNACGTLALLHLVLNREDAIECGPTLKEFKDFTADFPPDMRGTALGQCCRSALFFVHRSLRVAALIPRTSTRLVAHSR